MPAGNERDAAFSSALQEWVYRDPESVMRWIEGQPPSRDLDRGMEAVATLPALLHRPEVALDWAAYIVDDELRSRTRTSLLRQWASRDIAAARRYVESLPGAQPAERHALLSELERLQAPRTPQGG